MIKSPVGLGSQFVILIPLPSFSYFKLSDASTSSLISPSLSIRSIISAAAVKALFCRSGRLIKSQITFNVLAADCAFLDFPVGKPSFKNWVSDKTSLINFLSCVFVICYINIPKNKLN